MPKPSRSAVLPTTEVARELARLAARSATRVLPRGSGERDWRPGSVVNPADGDGQTFTDVGAWTYVVELLEAGLPPVPVQLGNGKRAYVLKHALPQGTLYIKLQIGTGRVIGRSFHYSDCA